MPGRRLIGFWSCALAASWTLGGCQPQSDATDQASIARPLNPSYWPLVVSPRQVPMKGHERVTLKAIDYLNRRNLLPPVMNERDDGFAGPNTNLIVYGTYFADNSGVGFPGSPFQEAPNLMTARVPVRAEITRTQGTFSYAVLSDRYFNPTANVDALTRVVWERGGPGSPSLMLTYALDLGVTSNIPLDLFVDVASILFAFGIFALPDPEPMRQHQQFAVDNFYHYGLGDLYDLHDPAIGSIETSLRLFPLYAEQLANSPAEFQSWDLEQRDAAQTLTGRMVNQKLLTGSDFGVTKYGAVLYQQARKFFVGSRAAPDLAELIKVGNDVPGWHTGQMQGHGDLDEMYMPLPHSYLGGMPNICSGSSSLDPCADGQPTWPIWAVGTQSPDSTDVGSHQTPRPGTSNRSALIYLGWACHMIQDAAMPHHVANWTGPDHLKQDDLGDLRDYFDSAFCDDITGDCTPAPPLSMDNYAPMIQEVNALLGTEQAPKSRRDICRLAGIGDSEVISGSLNWQSVRPVFFENLRRSYAARQGTLDPSTASSTARDYIKNAILGTIKLILCSVPDADPSVWGENNKDFNNDLNSDVLWNNTDDGRIAVWLLNGTTVIGDSDLSWGVAGSSGWEAKGTGDFNHDGHTDILWYHGQSGLLSVWFMNGTTVVSTDTTLSMSVPSSAGWEIKGTGDFNHDGHTDILWYHGQSGLLSVWSMNGTTIVSTNSTLSGIVPSSLGWEVKGTGDFNHDGQTDVLWYQAQTGLVSPWFMNGTTVMSAPAVDLQLPASSGWQLVGTGDFDRNSQTDILWRNPTTGQVRAWLMNGTTVIDQRDLSQTVFGSAWSVISH